MNYILHVLEYGTRGVPWVAVSLLSVTLLDDKGLISCSP